MAFERSEADRVWSAGGLPPVADPPAGIGEHLARLAAAEPAREMLVVGDQRLTWGQVEAEANRTARVLVDRGVTPGSCVAIVLSNVPDFFITAIAAWKLGAMVVPLSHRYAPRERAELYELARPAVAVVHERAMVDGPSLLVDELRDLAAGQPDDPMPITPGAPWKAIPSGGSTGRPKLIVAPGTGPIDDRLSAGFGIRPAGVEIIAGPLYHNGPFLWGLLQLVAGGSLVILDRFDPERWLATIESERVTWSFVVPTMLHRILDLPDEVLGRYDHSNLETLMLSAAPTPAWLKRRAIEVFGAETVWETYGATEQMCSMIRGDEWLEHPGSVGRPVGDIAVKIVGDEGRPLPVGEVGAIWVRGPKGPAFSYLGSEERIDGGWVSVGDLGWLDDEGYLYISDRRTDMIISGGVNLFPAEIEAVLLEHPAVADAAVIGLPDEEWGQRVHAVVQPDPAGAAPAVDDLDAWCRSRLAGPKVPRSFELVTTFPRDPSGKLRRSALRDARVAPKV